MQQDPVAIIKQIVDYCGQGICDNPTLFKNVYLDLSKNSHTKELDWVLAALHEGVPKYLLNKNGSAPNNKVKIAAANLATKAKLPSDIALQAVNILAVALEVIPSALHSEEIPEKDTTTRRFVQFLMLFLALAVVVLTIHLLNNKNSDLPQKKLPISRGTNNPVNDDKSSHNNLNPTPAFPVLKPSPNTTPNQAPSLSPQSAPIRTPQINELTPSSAPPSTKDFLPRIPASPSSPHFNKDDPHRPDSFGAQSPKIKQFVRQYINTWNNADADSAIQFYDNNVDLFDQGIKSKDYILNDMLKFFVRWPTRRSQELSTYQVRDTSSPDEKEVSFVFRYYRRRSGKPWCSSGVAYATLRLKEVSNTYRIIGIHETLKRDPQGECIEIP